MKILITGAAGFIGSNFTYYIANNYPEYEIIAIDFLTYAGNLETLLPLIREEKIKFYKIDIANKNDVRALFVEHNFDIVVNFAAESHVDKSIEAPEIFLQTNILGTQILIENAKSFNVSRFHQVSTDEVYGDLPLDNKTLFFTEKSIIKPSSPYAASKAAADMLVMSYFRTYDMPITISRCSNNYGPYQFPEKLIPLMISKALKNELLPVYGTGENIRDWLYVEDHCRAIDKILHKGKIGEVYNIGGHNEKTNMEVVKTILMYLGKSESLIEFVEDRKGHDLRYAIDPQKISSELGWKPSTKFDVGIVKTIEWYLKNDYWTQNILSGKYKRCYSKYIKGLI